MTTTPAVAFRGITKRFPGVLAIDDVSVDVAEGSFHALCGENGAGKSTLGKILAGIYQADAGEVRLFGRPLSSASPEAALAAGVGMVHQELAFCENLSVAENLCLRALPARAGFVSKHEMRRQAEALARGRGCALRRGSHRWGADDRAAADAADRRSRGARRAGDRLRRADEQSVPARGRTTLRPDRAAQGTRRDRYLHHPPDGRDLPTVRYRHRVARRPPRRHASGRRARYRGHRRDDDRAPACGVFPRRGREAARAGTAARDGPCRVQPDFATCHWRFGRARWWGLAGLSEPGGRRWRVRSSGWTHGRRARSKSVDGPCAFGHRATRCGSALASSQRIESVKGSCSR